MTPATVAALTPGATRPGGAGYSRPTLMPASTASMRRDARRRRSPRPHAGPRAVPGSSSWPISPRPCGRRWPSRRCGASMAIGAVRGPRRMRTSNPGKRRIYVIADNARYHHARVVRQWLERPDCRITLVFLPGPCTPSQRHREVMVCHAPRSDPQQVPCELQPLRRRCLRFLSPTNATRVDKMARYRHP